MKQVDWALVILLCVLQVIENWTLHQKVIVGLLSGVNIFLKILNYSLLPPKLYPNIIIIFNWLSVQFCLLQGYCQWNFCGIDNCQVLKYQSLQSYKVLHLSYLSFWSWVAWEYVYLWFWWLIYQHLTIVNAPGTDKLNPSIRSNHSDWF